MTASKWPRLAEKRRSARFRLRLFVSGATPRSTRAIANIKSLAEKRLQGRYDLEVIDAYQDPELVRDQQILVLPTLVKELPPPLRRLVGDLSNEDSVMVGLGLEPEPEPLRQTAKKTGV